MGAVAGRRDTLRTGTEDIPKVLLRKESIQTPEPVIQIKLTNVRASRAQLGSFPFRKRIYQVLVINSAASPALGPNIWLLVPALLRLMFEIYRVPTFISHSFLLLKIIIENFITVRFYST